MGTGSRRVRTSRDSAFRAATIAAAALSLSGCGGASAPASSGSPAAAEAAIDAARFVDPASLNAIVSLAEEPSAASAATSALAGHPSGAELWAAVYLYMNAGADPTVLEPYLSNPGPTVRVMAATGEVLMGNSSGFPVLIAALGQTTLLAGSEPPQPVWLFAAQSLVDATAISRFGPPFDAGPAAVAAAQARWDAWWHANGTRLRWNASEGLWSAA